VGFGVGFGLLLIALVGKHHEDMTRAGLIVIFVVAVLTIPTFLSGSAAEYILRGGSHGAPRFPAGVSVPAIRAHEDAALYATIMMEVTGFFAWLALWQWRKTSRLARWNIAAVIVLSLLTFAAMARTADLGGSIRHPEFRSAAEQAAAAVTPVDWPGEGTARDVGLWVVNNTWVWPACETLHFVGLCLLFAAVLLVDLRALGFAKGVPISAVYQLLPVGILGFGINMVTGFLFFLGAPQQYVENGTFAWKFVFLALAAANDLYFMLSNKTWGLGRGDEAPAVAKFVAGSGIFLWIGVLFFGHMLPFLGNAF
jgi:hypothetical protein